MLTQERKLPLFLNFLFEFSKSFMEPELSRDTRLIKINAGGKPVKLTRD